MFADRTDAGRRLAAALAHLAAQNPVVLALPRGGVPVGFEVAKALGAPLDVLLVRKIGAPFQPELAAAAVVDGPEPVLVRNEEVIRAYGIEDSWIRAEMKRELREIERRRKLYCGDRPPVPVRGRTAIVVDDGIATGTTVRAALRALAKLGPARRVLAVPVAPPDSLAALASEADEIVALEQPEWMGAVGQFYLDFTQTSDEEVIRLLAQAARPPEEA
ncbi:MAG: phosphoribosyltransferase family protein [Geminicoccaceae bacterium]|nr:phosphoribosyltransferase family protein [Geminicoccaceae bacterium]MCX7630402.1 phosphoribosyltransferase family protein [Geminicoccaceae bacterium]MDW8124118.1 phosphoribosyltransferase family protein [Geminicoccaceae bacterium]MDW8340219.1 phosphoribosyltransferase family protein [Geminicoccaceae bacterium]